MKISVELIRAVFLRYLTREFRRNLPVMSKEVDVRVRTKPDGEATSLPGSSRYVIDFVMIFVR